MSSDGKGTKRDEVEEIARQIGKMPKGYELIEPPAELIHIWQIYCEIYSIEEISLQAIKNYKDLYSLDLKPYEVDLLTEIERARKWLQMQQNSSSK